MGSKGALKGKPKIFIVDAAVRNAVLMIEDVLSEEELETVTPILRVPAIVFLYLLGKTEAEGQNGKL